MKKVTFVSVIVLCLGGLSQAGWDKIATLPPEHRDLCVNKIYFIDTLQGWIVGGDDGYTTPYLAKSNNGGRSWTAQLADTRLAYIWDICFTDNNVGWMVGEAKQSYGDSTGLIYKTSDGGLTWSLVLDGKHIYRPLKIIFPTQTTGYFFCSSAKSNSNIKKEGYGAIGRTKDGGGNWTIDTLSGFERSFCDIHFINADTGWAVGKGDRDMGDSAGFIMRTVNGGESWDLNQATGVISASEISSVFFITDKRGWIGGKIRDNPSFLAHTEDGGNTWMDFPVFQEYGSTGTIVDIHFINDSLGWVVGNDAYLYFTSSAGMDWATERFDSYGNIYTSFFLGSNYAWLYRFIFGGRPVIYKTNDYGGYLQGVSIQSDLRPKSQPQQLVNIKILSVSNGKSSINYTLNTDALLSMSVYDLRGVKIAFLPKRFHVKGEHKFSVKIPKGFYVVETKIYNGTKENKFTQKIFVR